MKHHHRRRRYARDPGAPLRCLLACLAMASVAAAQGDSVSISGQVGSDVELPPPWGATAATDVWTLSYCVDPFTEDTDDSPGLGVYEGALTSVSFSVDGIEVAGDIYGLNVITVADDFSIFFGVSDFYLVDFELANGATGKFKLQDSVLSPALPVTLTSDALISCAEAAQLPTASLSFYADAVGTPGFADLPDPADLECGACALPECLLVLGDGWGVPGQFSAIGHTFPTQVGDVTQSYPVTLEETPEIVIWEAPAPARAALVGLAPIGHGAGTGHALPLGASAPPQFLAAQVLMWNPQVFPSDPEQSSHGLAALIFSDGRVVTAPFGVSDGGLAVWAETDWNAQGQKVLRFPFSIPGF